MSSPRQRYSVERSELVDALKALRSRFNVPDSFSAAVLNEARAAADHPILDVRGAGASRRVDALDIPFTAVDPPGAKDLDQALHVERDRSGWTLYYAIADLGVFIVPRGEVDAEARRRGTTIYLPYEKSPLHPEGISEGAASLLPGVDRPALLWTLRFDSEGANSDIEVSRALVRTRRAISYDDAQTSIDRGEDDQLTAVAELGEARIDQEAKRGGISLEMPEQEANTVGDGTVELQFRAPLPIESWNAQMSLATGMAAAKLMLDQRQGLLRTMPEPDSEQIAELERASAAAGVPWPAGETPAEQYRTWVRTLHGFGNQGGALLTQSARALRGASYEAFDGRLPEQRTHSAVAAPYAHATAPLRRLGDRFVNEIVLAHGAGEEPPDWALEALPSLPDILNDANRRAAMIDRAAVDVVEAAILANHVGRTFDGVVLSHRREGALVRLANPPIVATITEEPEVGAEVTVVVRSADVSAGITELELVSTTARS